MKKMIIAAPAALSTTLLIWQLGSFDLPERSNIKLLFRLVVSFFSDPTSVPTSWEPTVAIVVTALITLLLWVLAYLLFPKEELHK